MGGDFNEIMFDSLLDEEERYWKMRSREVWLRWGDKNTKWFHSKATHQRKKNNIKGIRNRNGKWTEEEGEIGQIAKDYFKSIYVSTQPNPEVIIEEDKSRWLDKDFPKEEIESTLESMNLAKALSLDGAHASFFKKYWDVVGGNVSVVCIKIFN